MTASQTQRVAIVGCGKIADDHAETLGFMDGIDVVACCDLTYLMAEQLATRFDIAGVYDDFDRLLEEQRPDVVHITTPPQSHLALAVAAMQAGAHVWVEKPLAMNSAEVEQMTQVAKATGRKLTVGHSYWFDTPALDLRTLVTDGRIGEVVHVESWYGYDLDGDYGKAIMSTPDNWVHHLPGKLFQNNVDHLFNKVMEFLPSEDLLVQATAFRRHSKTYGDRRDALLDELRVYMADPTGPTAYATFSSAAAPRGHWVRVYGTKGSATADFNLRTVEVAAGVSLPTNLGRLLPSITKIGSAARQAVTNTGRFATAEFHYFAGFRRLLDAFYASITDGAPDPIPLAEMERMTRIQDRIWAQLPASGLGSQLTPMGGSPAAVGAEGAPGGAADLSVGQRLDKP
ncbi:MAG: Gfo/Idh/MocA family protein [Acidimicrobiales bacterium]